MLWGALPVATVLACSQIGLSRPPPAGTSSSTGTAAPGTGTRVHEVSPGESVCSIAGYHGVDAAALRRLNGLGETTDALSPGTTLEIPVDQPLTYRVRRGDTLTAISRWSGVPLAELARSNDLADPDRLRAGSLLRLPPRARTACPPATTARAGARTADGGTAPRASGIPEPSAVSRPSEPEAPRPLRLADARLLWAEHYYEQGDFVRAIADADLVAPTLEGWEADDRARRIQARANVIAALSQVGLGDTDAAVARFESALRWDPDLVLDPEQHSPKVIELFEAARRRAPR
jgi:LysM repeat protein